MEENKKEIEKKVHQVYEKKLVKHNLIREEEKERPMRIAIKKAERLMQLVPERRELV
jgi:BMFP domain-containing protein YqiC